MTGNAAKLHLAVASNFLATAQQLKPAFKTFSGDDLLLSSGSTGMLFAQISQGAPYDVLLSADTATPQRLLAAGLASDPFIYARGQLVLLANQNHSERCQDILFSAELRYLAIANPELAPYGLAAKQFLLSIGWWEQHQSQLVMGENVAQAMQMTVSENATAGLVAAAVLAHHELLATQCAWQPPNGSYTPIDQAMTLLTRSTQQRVYQRFKSFLQSESAKKIIQANGYTVNVANQDPTRDSQND